MTDVDFHSPMSSDDVSFGERLFSEFMEFFWSPEIERRGGSEVVGTLSKALVIMMPGEPISVRLNEEAVLVGRAIATRPIEAGAAVNLEIVGDLAELFPHDVHPDAGWACMVILPNGRGVVSFDFRRNRGQARDRLVRATEFLESAEGAVRAGHVGPAIDATHAAAELVVSALAMMLEAAGPASGGGRNSHGKRQGWLAQWARLGNVASESSAALGRLGQLRGRARYADGPMEIEEGELQTLLAIVQDQLAHGFESVGNPVPSFSGPDVVPGPS